MAKSTPKLVDQLAADPQEREARGEFLFEGAGDVILKLRLAKKLVLEDVAEKLGVARSTVMRYEKNDTPLSDYAVMRFAEVYEVNPEWLMLECMKLVLPGMIDSPFGKLMERVIQDGAGTSKAT
jgi:DNA-binding XRE family transcriptional regulator